MTAARSLRNHRDTSREADQIRHMSKLLLLLVGTFARITIPIECAPGSRLRKTLRSSEFNKRLHDLPDSNVPGPALCQTRKGRLSFNNRTATGSLICSAIPP